MRMVDVRTAAVSKLFISNLPKNTGSETDLPEFVNSVGESLLLIGEIQYEALGPSLRSMAFRAS